MRLLWGERALASETSMPITSPWPTWSRMLAEMRRAAVITPSSTTKSGRVSQMISW